jgi:hypothetical protein
VGELIVVQTPRITMQGHLENTTLRACEHDEYQRMELAVASSIEEDESWAAVTRCGMSMLAGGNVAIQRSRSSTHVCVACSGAVTRAAKWVRATGASDRGEHLS